MMEFAGDPGPQKVSLLLVSGKFEADSLLFASLNPLVTGARRTMVVVSRAQLAAAAAVLSASGAILAREADRARIA